MNVDSEAKIARWNYRMTRELMPTGEYLYAVREVYYGDNDAVTAWSLDPIAPASDNPLDVALDLARMASCITDGVVDLETRETVTGLPLTP